MSGRGLNRRGHLSSKIPNVKLRPASSAVPGKTKEADPLNAMDQEMLDRVLAEADDEELSSAALRSTKKPWENVRITFTGVDDKPNLTELAKRMGADISSALTKETTHVVASGFGSAKYLYAVEHRIPVMRPDWIYDTHTSWINAEEVDLASSMEGQKLLPFTGLTISISGVNDMERRKQLIDAINKNGGTYAKDLDSSATHLVSATPTEVKQPSAKVKWAVGNLKQNEAKRRAGKAVDSEDINIVYEDWIWDCVGYEGRWKEDWYDARKVRRTSRTTYDEVMDGTAKDKMIQAYNRLENINQDEPAILKKRKRNHVPNLVNDLISTAGGQRSNLTAFMSRSTDMEVDGEFNGDTDISIDVEMDGDAGGSSRRPDPSTLDRPGPKRKASVLHTSRSSAFAGPSRLSREIHAECPSSSSIPSTHPTSRLDFGKGPSTGTGIFSGKKCVVSVLLPEDVGKFSDAIVAHGAQLVSEDDWLQGEKVDYLIYRFHEKTMPDLSHLPEEDRPQVGTDCWIEHSMHTARLIPLDEHITFAPLAKRPRGADELRVHVAGFGKIGNAMSMKRLARAIGFTMSEKMSRRTTHVVLSEPMGVKWEKALEWGIMPMKASWLTAIAKSGQLQPEEPHLWGTGGEEDKNVERSERGVSAATEKNEEVKVESEDVNMDGGDVNDGLRDLEHPPIPQAVDKINSAETSRNSAVNSSPTTKTSRQLKSTPTHIDHIPSAADRPSTSSTSFPLSPPKQETERILNQATILPSPNRRLLPDSNIASLGKPKSIYDGESIESKLSRNSSAPVPITSSPPAPVIARSISLAGVNPSTSRSGMSDLLKSLAQTTETSFASPASSTGSRSSRPVRRARPSNPSGSGISKLRTSMAYTAIERDGGEIGDTSAHFSTSPSREYGMHMDMGMGMGGDTGYDESMRVDYVDPTAEREKSRLVNAMMTGTMMSAPGSSKKGDSSVEKEKETRPKAKKRR